MCESRSVFSVKQRVIILFADFRWLHSSPLFFNVVISRDNRRATGVVGIPLFKTSFQMIILHFHCNQLHNLFLALEFSHRSPAYR